MGIALTSLDTATRHRSDLNAKRDLYIACVCVVYVLDAAFRSWSLWRITEQPACNGRGGGLLLLFSLSAYCFVLARSSHAFGSDEPNSWPCTVERSIMKHFRFLLYPCECGKIDGFRCGAGPCYTAGQTDSSGGGLRAQEPWCLHVPGRLKVWWHVPSIQVRRLCPWIFR